MSMWYLDTVELLILKDMVCPGSTLICVAKPWIAVSPWPLTCQSLGGSPGFVFSHAITLVTGGPHGPAAAAGRPLTAKSKLSSTASTRPMTDRRANVLWGRSPVPDMINRPPARLPLSSLYLEQTRKRHTMDSKEKTTK